MQYRYKKITKIKLKLLFIAIFYTYLAFFFSKIISDIFSVACVNSIFPRQEVFLIDLSISIVFNFLQEMHTKGFCDAVSVVTINDFIQDFRALI